MSHRSWEYFDDINDQLAEQAADQRAEHAAIAHGYGPDQIERPEHADLADLEVDA